MSDLFTPATAQLECRRESVLLRTGAGEVAQGWDAPSGSELSADIWMQAVRDCRAHAMDRGLLDGITTVAISGDLEVHVVTDAEGVPLRPAFCGPDERMAPDVGWLLTQLPGAGDDWERITGAVPHSGQLVARCSWLHRSAPELWAHVRRLCSLPEWVAGQLVEHPVAITAEMAAASGFWSISDASYVRLICALIDADRSLELTLGRVDAVGRDVIGTWEGLDVQWA